MSRVQTTSSGNTPATIERRNGCSNRAKWMTVGAGCCVRLAASSDSASQASCRSTAARIMCLEMPVIRETAGGICSPSGSAIRHACECVTVVRTRAQPISRRWPRGAAAVAWQSIARTSRCESGSARLPSTIYHDRST